MPSVPPHKIDYPKYVDSLWCIYIVSVVGAWNAEFVTYPFDLIKTRLQIQGETSAKIGQAIIAQNIKGNGGTSAAIEKAPYRGMLRTAIGVSKEEGIRQLWKGVHAAMFRHLIYSGTRIVTFKELRDSLIKQQPNQNVFPLYQSALCGVTAGAFAQYLASPADLLKVQLQMEGKRKLLGLPPRVNGMWDAFLKVWNTGGIRGLWKGSIPNVQRAALVNLGDLTTYDYTKRFFLKHTSLPDNYFLHTICSSIAGLIAALLGTPADVIKTRVMNQPFDEHGRALNACTHCISLPHRPVIINKIGGGCGKNKMMHDSSRGLLYKSSIDCFQKTVREEGFAALYKGFIPCWLRMAPWSLTFWLTYEEIIKVIGGHSW